MAAKDQEPKQPDSLERDAESTQEGWNKPTEFGEPLWVDVLKTLGVGMIMLSLTIIVGGALGVAIMAPWGRASHDCSIYCVIRKELNTLFSDKPPESGGRSIERNTHQLAGSRAIPQNHRRISLRKGS